MLHIARAAGGDDGDGDHLPHGGEHFQIEAPLHAVGVDAVHHQFPGPALLALVGPLQGVDTGIDASSLGEDAKGPIHPLDIHAQHHALVAVALGGAVDQIRVFDGPGIDAHLVRPAGQHPFKIRNLVDGPAHGEGNEHLGRRALENVREQAPALEGGRNIIEHQLVGPGVVVVFRHLHRVGHVLDALEVGALHHAAVPHVQTGNDSFGNHMISPFSASAPAAAMACLRSIFPAYRALPMMAAYRFIFASASTFSREETPPEATTRRPLISPNFA